MQSETQTHPVTVTPTAAPSHRRRALRALFVHRDADAIDDCLEELKKAQFTVSSDFVLNMAQCLEQLKTQSYEVIVVEYPSLNRKRSDVLQALVQIGKETPVIFLTDGRGSQFIGELMTVDEACDYVEQKHLTQLPAIVRRVLNERKLRAELEEAKKALRHSQSLYHALADNPTYGTYRCDAEGKLLDVNLALVEMLGFTSKQELMAANQQVEIIPNLRKRSGYTGLIAETNRIEPVELDWKRKDGTILKARISGRGIADDRGNIAGHEIIVMDVTEQRTLEDQLRHEAASDSLTGLANHRRLFEVLHSEICRSKRTGREFSLLLLDLDGLKKINDQFGHLVGDRALCRLSQVVSDCCRSLDTAARQGGDEFALVLPETGAAAASLVARRICDLVSKDTEHPALSVSVGVAGYPKDAQTIGTLLYAADRALYEMKSKTFRSAQGELREASDVYVMKGKNANA
jgi:diguanylate cyclase (GGDEF)-like protein/PAS domain S-box-containing protein